MSLRKVLEENVSGYDTSVMFSILGQVVELLKQDSAPEIPLEWSLPGLATFPCLAGPSFNTRIIECNYLPSQNWHLDLCILGYSVTSVHFLAYRPLVPTLAFSVQAAQFLDPIANLWLVSQLPAIETFQCKLAPLSLPGNRSAEANESNSVVLFLIIPFFLWFIQIFPFWSCSVPSSLSLPHVIHEPLSYPGHSLVTTQRLHSSQQKTISAPFLLKSISSPLSLLYSRKLSHSIFVEFAHTTSFFSRNICVPHLTDVHSLGFLLSSLLWADCLRAPPQIKLHGIVVFPISPGKEGRKGIHFYTISRLESDPFRITASFYPGNFVLSLSQSFVSGEDDDEQENP